MDYKYLQSFHMVAKELNFSKAAHRLRLTPAAVTKQIQSLEESIGVQLFIRSPKQVVLTRDAKDLLKKSLVFHEWVESRFHSTKQKTIFIGVLDPILKTFLPNVMAEYCKKHHHHIHISKGSPSQLKLKMQNAELDLCLLNKNIQSDVMTSKKIMTEKVVLISNKKVKLGDIQDHCWITVESKDYIINYAKKHKVGPPEQIIEVNSPLSQIDLVKRGLGIAMVSSLLLDCESGFSVQPVSFFKNEYMYLTSRHSKLISDHINLFKNMIEQHAKNLKL